MKVRSIRSIVYEALRLSIDSSSFSSIISMKIERESCLFKKECLLIIDILRDKWNVEKNFVRYITFHDILLAWTGSSRGEGVKDSDFTYLGVVDTANRHSGKTIPRTYANREESGEWEIPIAECSGREAVRNQCTRG